MDPCFCSWISQSVGKLAELWLRLRTTRQPREYQVWSVLIRKAYLLEDHGEAEVCAGCSRPRSCQWGSTWILGSVFELENRACCCMHAAVHSRRAHLEFLTLHCSPQKFLPIGTQLHPACDWAVRQSVWAREEKGKEGLPGPPGETRLFRAGERQATGSADSHRGQSRVVGNGGNQPQQELGKHLSQDCWASGSVWWVCTCPGHTWPPAASPLIFSPVSHKLLSVLWGVTF